MNMNTNLIERELNQSQASEEGIQNLRDKELIR